jgi:hypothetical protein
MSGTAQLEDYQEEVALKQGQRAPYAVVGVPEPTWRKYQACELNAMSMKDKYLSDEEVREMSAQASDNTLTVLAVGAVVGAMITVVVSSMVSK